MSEPSSEPPRPSSSKLSKLAISRRSMLGILIGTAATLPLAGTALAQQEGEPIPSPAELIQQPQALELCRSLHEAGRLKASVPIGWVGYTPVATHQAFFDCIDSANSKSYAEGVSPTDAQINTHETWAMHMATQMKTGGQPGLLQKDWSRIILTNLFGPGAYGGSDIQKDMTHYAEAITYLVDQGVGVIGTIPTWRDSELEGLDTESSKALKDGVINAYQYAADHHVVVVIPAGNANIDLANVKNKRTLHEIARTFDNVVIVGGTDQRLNRAQWTNGSTQQGSNYGKGFIDFVSTATRRMVPWGTADMFALLDGTTFCVGDVTSLIAILQNLFVSKTGVLPDPKKEILPFITETTKYLYNPDVSGSGLIQMHNTLSSAEKFIANRVASG